MFNSNLESAQSACKDAAMFCKTYYDELVAQGFTPDQAISIVNGWQRAVLGPQND